ncbi:MAG: hypothetical protein J6N70_03250 [Oribacterium sp.]|nr:hypothetical protein [Oribacterium sp.]
MDREFDHTYITQNILEECAKILIYNFLMYYEEMAMDLLKRNYIVSLAGSMDIELSDDPEI